VAYISNPLETDPGAISQEAFTYIQAQFPDWLPADGNLDTIMVEAFSQHVAELRELETDVRDQIYRYLGAKLHGILPIDATSATGTSTWTMIDNLGYTIPAGTQVAIPATGDEFVAFEVLDAVTVAPGATATAAGGVTLVAVEPGANGSGLTGAPQLIDALSYVASIILVGQTTGGVDAETDADYLDRLTAQLGLLAPRPILPADFAEMAREIGGVFRAVALDGYNPANASYSNERMVAVAGVGENGLVLSTAQKAAIDALLQSRREVNFVVNVMDPTYTAVTVAFVGVAVVGTDAIAVRDAAVAAVNAYLSPARWGLVGIGDSESTWINRPTVRYLDVSQAINEVSGFDYLTSLTVNGATADVTLPGAVPLPLGSSSGTVTAP
jgi:hypothetical protein